MQKKCKIMRVGALRGRLRKECKIKRVSGIKGQVEGGLPKKSAKLRGLGH